MYKYFLGLLDTARKKLERRIIFNTLEANDAIACSDVCLVLLSLCRFVLFIALFHSSKRVRKA